MKIHVQNLPSSSDWLKCLFPGELWVPGLTPGLVPSGVVQAEGIAIAELLFPLLY